jgi:hypothetical protein
VNSFSVLAGFTACFVFCTFEYNSSVPEPANSGSERDKSNKERSSQSQEVAQECSVQPATPKTKVP